MTAPVEHGVPGDVYVFGTTRVWLWQHFYRTGRFNQRTLAVENEREAWVTVSRSFATKDEALRCRPIRMAQHKERLVCRETTVTDRVVPHDTQDAVVSEVPVVRPAGEWCELLGWVIADRDGWRAPDALPWDSPITEADFLRRARMSTTLRAPKAATGEPIREGAFDDR